MHSNDDIARFLQVFREAAANGTFVRLTLSKPLPGAPAGLQNVYIRPVQLKAGPHLAFNHRYDTKDEVKNWTASEANVRLLAWLGEVFAHAQLMTTQGDLQLQTGPGSKTKLRQLPASHTEAASAAHDRQKKRLLDPAAPWLHHLGIADKKGVILPSAQDKWKQINKYLEIMDALLRAHQTPEDVRVADMGSGKGYLTFALYDYLRNSLHLTPQVVGIELRPHLVSFCNALAQTVAFDGLSFVAADIRDYNAERIDVLIALHACDTATDLALAKGIHAQAGVVVVAPCCHKHIRKAMHTQNELAPLMGYGILEERQAELLTDGIRALLLESEGYDTKVFEFVSTEHTAKNVMITATRLRKPLPAKRAAALEKVNALKTGFGIEGHYLETLL
ncbi:MAG: class I SAM-dependent methyltransferase [Saprospiraceae bacterium]